MYSFLENAIRSPAILVSRLIALLIAVTVHELGHAYIAYRMGDPTAKEQGQLTLNPMKHINVYGFLMFLIIGFGFLGQAPVNPRRMRNPRWGMTAAVAAGPLANLLTAIVFGIPWILHLIERSTNGVYIYFFPPFSDGQIFPTLAQLGIQIVFWNVLLFLFNLIPLYPLDGWTIVLGLLPAEQAHSWQKYQMQSYYLFFGLIILSFIAPQFDVLSELVWKPTIDLTGLLTAY